MTLKMYGAVSETLLSVYLSDIHPEALSTKGLQETGVSGVSEFGFMN